MDKSNDINDLGLKINELSSELERIRKLYEKTINYAESDPVVSLGQARRAAEAICRQMFINEISPHVKNLMLKDYIEKLVAANVLPKKIEIPLRTIQTYGNFGVHDQGEHSQDEEITRDYIQPCLSSLSTVVDWYFNEYYKASEKVQNVDHAVLGQLAKSKAQEDVNPKIPAFAHLKDSKSQGTTQSPRNSKRFIWGSVALLVVMAVFVGGVLWSKQSKSTDSSLGVSTTANPMTNVPNQTTKAPIDNRSEEFLIFDGGRDEADRFRERFHISSSGGGTPTIPHVVEKIPFAKAIVLFDRPGMGKDPKVTELFADLATSDKNYVNIKKKNNQLLIYIRGESKEKVLEIINRLDSISVEKYQVF